MDDLRHTQDSTTVEGHCCHTQTITMQTFKSLVAYSPHVFMHNNDELEQTLPES